MTDKKFNVVTIGNAIVDLFAQVDDNFLREHGLSKGEMRLVSKDEADEIYKAIKIFNQESGGSAANTAAALASLGSKVAFIGKIRDDELGEVFENGLKKAGVVCKTRKAKDGPATARCAVLLTPDAERTFNTYLGIAALLGPEDIDEFLISSTEIVYMEGYLWDKPPAKDAFLKAIDIAHKSGGKTALSLSDSFCVDRHRSGFLDLVKNRLDIVFANEDEIKALFEVDAFEKALKQCKKLSLISVITRGKKGSVVVHKAREYVIPAGPVSKVVDTTGAGDLYAAGFLHGFTHDKDLPTCGKIGSIAAAEIVGHLGARLKKRLSEIINDI